MKNVLKCMDEIKRGQYPIQMKKNVRSNISLALGKSQNNTEKFVSRQGSNNGWLQFLLL